MALINEKILSSNLHRFSHKAMATVYEIMIEYDDSVYAEQAAKAAFDEIDRLEEELSRFLPNSEISLINSLQIGDQLLLSDDTFECLRMSKRLTESTHGAFDITLGRFKGNLNIHNNEINSADKKFELNETERTIEILRDDLDIDLGGLGKGYGLDKVCELLLEWEVENAFIHGGGSSAKSIGRLSDFEGWPITLSNPNNSKQTLADILLQDFSISASGIRKGDHIIDPITSKPISKRNAAWALANSAAMSDALSTAFMIMDIDSIMELCNSDENIGAMIIEVGKTELAQNDLIISDYFKSKKSLT